MADRTLEENIFRQHVGLPLVPMWIIRSTMRPANWLLSRSLHLLVLSSLSLAGCKPKPMGCKVEEFYRPANAASGVGGASLESGTRLPRQTPMDAKPDFLKFSDSTHLVLEWVGHGHFYARSELTFSPDEKLARGEQARDESYPMILVQEEGRSLVRFSFKTRLCADPEGVEGGGYCREFKKTDEVLIAEAVCGR